MKALAAILLVPVIVAASLFLVFEGSLSIILGQPTLLPSFTPALRQFYQDSERSVIEASLNCSVYDKQLGYVLRPGRCDFNNREFESIITINQEGLRGDDQSLEKPKLIVIGDSQALGWGVQQYASFPAQLEISSGKRVLNAAISAYGTQRQLKMLDRLDRSALDWLIVQYSSEAYPENLEYLNKPSERVGPSEDDYRRAIMNNREASRYYLGKYVFELLPKLWSGTDVATKRQSETEALATSLSPVVNLLPARTNIVLLDVTPPAERNNEMLGQFEKLVSNDKRFQALNKRVVVLDLSARLDESMYYPLDQHLTPLGHRLIADELCKIIGCDGP